MRIIQRGAEAVLYLDEREGKRVLVKERVSKGYRVPELDARIRRQRTKNEVSLLERSRRSGASSPRVIESGGCRIVMEFIEGSRLKDVFNSMKDGERGWVCDRLGESIAMMHENSIIHGDLTTSNFILTRNPKKLYVIDFGLGRYSSKTEDKAVDLHVLYEAIKAAHFKHLNQAWQKILNAYKQRCSTAKEVLARLESIERRRRYK